LIKSVNVGNETSGSIFEQKLERREVWPLTRKCMEGERVKQYSKIGLALDVQ